MHQRMKANKDYVEKMNFQEFKTIQWDYMFPQFILDLFKYICGANIEEYIKNKDKKEQEDEKLKKLQDQIEKRKQGGEEVNEQ